MAEQHSTNTDKPLAWTDVPHRRRLVAAVRNMRSAERRPHMYDVIDDALGDMGNDTTETAAQEWCYALMSTALEYCAHEQSRGDEARAFREATLARYADTTTDRALLRRRHLGFYALLGSEMERLDTTYRDESISAEDP